MMADGDAARQPIARLAEDVVNRIAAGEEMIHRPANALKEMIENSLDAGAKQIHITLQDGGLKLLQIQDNGCGIPRDDLALVCERFATSKLREFSDLSRMRTFGFRGEALASVSFVAASMTIVSKTREESCAYRAEYASGKIVPAPGGTAAEPKPCAGTDGTAITAQDLFFNAPQRRRVFRYTSEEYNRCLDVAVKYAIHYAHSGVGFTCKKAGTNALDLNLRADASQTTLDAIRMVHGSKLARDLMHVEPEEDSGLGFTAEAWISNANWVSKKTTFLCFINHRLVECPALKRALEGMYSLVLPRGRHPWMYVSLEMDPSHVDVNVHPTKQEVHFLDEEAIVESITARAQAVLSQHSSCRVLSMSQPALLGERTSEYETQVTSPRPPVERYDPRHLIRVDPTAQTLDGLRAEAPGAPAAPDRIPESECELTSVQELRTQVVRERHAHLTHVLQNHTFVGVVDLCRALALVQHDTRLYVVNYAVVIEAFAYQLALRQFGAFVRVRLEPAPSVQELVALGYDVEDAAEQKQAIGLSRDEVVRRVTHTLVSRAEMLDEYFGMRIDVASGTLETIPALLPRHAAFGLAVERLPTLLFRLGPQVDWDEEQACFSTFCRELAAAHVPPSAGQARSAGGARDEEEKWNVQHVWFAHLVAGRGRFVVPRALDGRAVVQVANLPDLYRVFERC